MTILKNSRSWWRSSGIQKEATRGQSVSTLCIPVRLFLPQPFLFNTQCHRQASLSLLCTQYFSSLFFFFFNFFSLKEPGLLCSAGVSLASWDTDLFFIVLSFFQSALCLACSPLLCYFSSHSQTPPVPLVLRWLFFMFFPTVLIITNCPFPLLLKANAFGRWLYRLTPCTHCGSISAQWLGLRLILYIQKTLRTESVGWRNKDTQCWSPAHTHVSPTQSRASTWPSYTAAKHKLYQRTVYPITETPTHPCTLLLYPLQQGNGTGLKARQLMNG